MQWDQLLLLIKDDGVGIADEKRKSIEERMYAEETLGGSDYEGLPVRESHCATYTSVCGFSMASRTVWIS